MAILLSSCLGETADVVEDRLVGQATFTSFDARVDTLIAKMTLDEKVGQMTQPDQEFLNDVDLFWD
jgi:hypothetical protein